MERAKSGLQGLVSAEQLYKVDLSLLIFKRWIVGKPAIKNEDNKEESVPAESYRHPAWQDGEDAISDGEGEGVGVYYLAKVRSFHNHPLDLNLMRDDCNVAEINKKRVPGRTNLHNENWLMYGCYY